mmetsp:Transcript_56887/g.94380  ORF Transcript_56887/g.94380 Transcript_56887/m.94380 type:complete len:216 (-) Transcript_56887:105-752(-)
MPQRSHGSTPTHSHATRRTRPHRRTEVEPHTDPHPDTETLRGNARARAHAMRGQHTDPRNALSDRITQPRRADSGRGRQKGEATGPLSQRDDQERPDAAGTCMGGACQALQRPHQEPPKSVAMGSSRPTAVSRSPTAVGVVRRHVARGARGCWCPTDGGWPVAAGNGLSGRARAAAAPFPQSFAISECHRNGVGHRAPNTTHSPRRPWPSCPETA